MYQIPTQAWLFSVRFTTAGRRIACKHTYWPSKVRGKSLQCPRVVAYPAFFTLMCSDLNQQCETQREDHGWNSVTNTIEEVVGKPQAKKSI